MKPVRRRRPWLGAVGHTSPRPSRAPASSEQRGSQDARADPNAGLRGPANQIRASRHKQGVVRPTSMSTDKATRRPRRRPGSLPYRRDPSSAGPARACSGRRAGARVKTAAWRRNRRSTATRSSSTSLLPWTNLSSGRQGRANLLAAPFHGSGRRRHTRAHSRPGWTKSQALVRAGNARRRQDRQGRASPPAAGRPRDLVPQGTCDHAPGSDASSIRNDTPSAAAVENVLWTRRHREARPAGEPVADSIATGATQRLSISWWSWPLGHSLGQTLPY
jgi:hypothetical protein